MPTVDTYTIDPLNSGWDGTSAGEPYEIAALISALQTEEAYNYAIAGKLDLPAADKRVVILIKGGLGVVDEQSNADFTTANWIVDSTHYITVKAHPDYTHAGIYDDNKARFHAYAGQPALTISIPFMRIGPGLCFLAEDAFETLNVNHVSDNPTYVTGCIFKIISPGVSHHAINFTGGTGHEVTNCIAYSADSGAGTSITFFGVSLASNAKTVLIDSCTIVDFAATNGTTSFFIMCSTGTVTSNNNYFGGFSDDDVVYDDNGGTGVVNPGSNDATFNTEATTPGLQQVPTTTDVFTNTTFATADFHLASSSPLLDTGIGALPESSPPSASSRGAPPRGDLSHHRRFLQRYYRRREIE